MQLDKIIIGLNADGSFRIAAAYGIDGMPTQLSPEALAAIAPEINGAALARVAELESELAANKTALAEVDALKARIVELTPLPPENPSLITQLHAAFTSTLPPEAQAAFAMPYAIVRVLVEAEQYALAAAVIAGIEVPAELEEAKQGLILLIPAV